MIIIGVAKLTRTGQEIVTENYRAVEVWFTVALIYLIILSAFSYLLQWIEKKVKNWMSIVEFSNVAKRFGNYQVLKGLNPSIDAGEIVFLIGPSGSGKSTLLRCINVLETIDDGDLIVDGIGVRGSRRDIRQIRLEAGMVFQQFNLFPHLTALENIMFVR